MRGFTVFIVIELPSISYSASFKNAALAFSCATWCKLSTTLFASIVVPSENLIFSRSVNFHVCVSMFSAFDTSHGVISMLSSTLNKVSPIPYRTVNHPFHSKAESNDAVNCSVPMRIV